MPNHEPQRKPIGRPKRHEAPRRSTTVRIERDNDAWIDRNLPRSCSLSDFINEAIREKIARKEGVK